MKLKRAGVANIGEEEKAQLEMDVKTRARTRAEAQTLFADAGRGRVQDLSALRRLFFQFPVAQTSGMSPLLSQRFKAAPKNPHDSMLAGATPSKLVTASVTANVDAFFNKLAEAQLTQAQRRYPELLKVSGAPGGRGSYPSPGMKKRVVTPISGTSPTQSSLSGGAA